VGRVDRDRVRRSDPRLAHLRRRLGWGDNNIFDWGSILGSIIGAVIVLMIVNWYLRIKRIAT